MFLACVGSQARELGHIDFGAQVGRLDQLQLSEKVLFVPPMVHGLSHLVPYGDADSEYLVLVFKAVLFVDRD